MIYQSKTFASLYGSPAGLVLLHVLHKQQKILTMVGSTVKIEQHAFGEDIKGLY